MPTRQKPLSLYQQSMEVGVKFLMILNSYSRNLQLTDHKLIKPHSKQLIKYLKLLPRKELENILKEFLKIQEFNNLNNFYREVPDLLLFLPLGIPVDITCGLTSLSFPIVDYFKNHSQNLRSLTLGKATRGINKTSIRTLFFCLDQLKELNISDRKLIKVCVDFLTGKYLLPNLVSLILKSEFLMDKVSLAEHPMLQVLLTREKLKKLRYKGDISFFRMIQERRVSLHMEEMKINVPWDKSYDLTRDLVSMAACCKNVSSLELSCFFKDEIRVIMDLEHLTSLKLHNRNNLLASQDWKKIFGKWPKMNELLLENFSDICVETLMETVPELKSLSLYFCQFVTALISKKRFKNLEKLSVIESRGNSLSENVIFLLLSDSTKLRRVEFRGKTSSLTDKLFSSIIADNNFVNLKYLQLIDCRLTINSVKAILLNVENTLRDIHIHSNLLFRNDSITVKRLILENNLELAITLMGANGMWNFINNKVV